MALAVLVLLGSFLIQLRAVIPNPDCACYLPMAVEMKWEMDVRIFYPGKPEQKGTVLRTIGVPVE